MNVSQLIAHLQTLPQDLLVVRPLFSEQVLVQREDIGLVVACAPREDDWVHDRRPDKPTQTYVCLGVV